MFLKSKLQPLVDFMDVVDPYDKYEIYYKMCKPKIHFKVGVLFHNC